MYETAEKEVQDTSCRGSGCPPALINPSRLGEQGVDRGYFSNLYNGLKNEQ
jgi:hypothetical protein